MCFQIDEEDCEQICIILFFSLVCKRLLLQVFLRGWCKYLIINLVQVLIVIKSTVEHCRFESNLYHFLCRVKIGTVLWSVCSLGCFSNGRYLLYFGTWWSNNYQWSLLPYLVYLLCEIGQIGNCKDQVAY